MTPDLGTQVARVLGRPLGEVAVARLEKYLELLREWQKVVRLVGSTDRTWLVENVVLDSLLYTKVLPLRANKIADFGAGAGVPGIPLAIALPDAAVTLIEARQKRRSFLAHVIRELGLRATTLVGGRLTESDIPADLVNAFDVVVMRCAGDLSAVLPTAQRLTNRGGVVIASGPPEEHPLPAGRWIAVGGTRDGGVRRFVVVGA